MVFVGKEADVGLFSVVLPRWKPGDVSKWIRVIAGLTRNPMLS